MDSLQLPIPADVYATLLKECTHLRDAIGGAEVHAHMNRSRRDLLPRPGLPLANRLLLMYAVCGHLRAARKLFNQMVAKDSISWATMIVGYVDNHQHNEAQMLFAEMQHQGLEITGSTIVSVIKACLHTGDFGLGKQVHGWIVKVGRSLDLFLRSSLINFYGKFGSLESARLVFDQTSHRDTVLWTAMMVHYCREEHFDDALDVYREMGRAGARKNHFTFSSVLRACSRMKKDKQYGRPVHASAIKLGFESDLFVQSSLVDMYGKCGLLGDARRAFEMIEDKKNDVCWNAMLSGYMHHGYCIEAVKFLYQMKAAGMQPQESMLNEVKIVCGTSNCKNLLDLKEK
ncbi:hypothetical protein HHK36_026225 [Tetracentron sinense]|uniref:Pentatricopeptide repeat-containing protein n=1 Tax=Tetracentron sinense TaxID=13715 RepID=A0A835D2F0_TETSI|nr:hypothetical protein HHK36_026225 [Tetracentron sinense]